MSEMQDTRYFEFRKICPICTGTNARIIITSIHFCCLQSYTSRLQKDSRPTFNFYKHCTFGCKDTISRYHVTFHFQCCDIIYNTMYYFSSLDNAKNQENTRKVQFALMECWKREEDNLRTTENSSSEKCSDLNDETSSLQMRENEKVEEDKGSSEVENEEEMKEDTLESPSNSHIDCEILGRDGSISRPEVQGPVVKEPGSGDRNNGIPMEESNKTRYLLHKIFLQGRSALGADVNLRDDNVMEEDTDRHTEYSSSEEEMCRGRERNNGIPMDVAEEDTENSSTEEDNEEEMKEDTFKSPTDSHSEQARKSLKYPSKSTLENETSSSRMKENEKVEEDRHTKYSSSEVENEKEMYEDTLKSPTNSHTEQARPSQKCNLSSLKVNTSRRSTEENGEVAAQKDQEAKGPRTRSFTDQESRIKNEVVEEDRDRHTEYFSTEEDNEVEIRVPSLESYKKYKDMKLKEEARGLRPRSFTV